MQFLTNAFVNYRAYFLGNLDTQTHIRLDMCIAYPARHLAHQNNHALELIDSLAFKHGATCKLLVVDMLKC